MREIRTSGSEGGAGLKSRSYLYPGLSFELHRGGVVNAGSAEPPARRSRKEAVVKLRV